jgi:hypothetical protein
VVLLKKGCSLTSGGETFGIFDIVQWLCRESRRSYVSHTYCTSQGANARYTAEVSSRTLDLKSGRTEFDEGFERFPVAVPAWPDHHKPTL